MGVFKELDILIQEQDLQDPPVADEQIKKLVEKRESAKLGKVQAFLKSQSPAFMKACEAVKLPATRRQASKWLLHKGKAWKEGR